MHKKWVLPVEVDKEAIRSLAEALSIKQTLAKLLINRGIDTYEKAKDYFRPDISELHDPFHMKDMDKAVGRLNEAIFNEEKILVYGDYDVDGTTSVSLVYSFLKEFYPNIDTYVPDRYTEGYGISEAGIDYAQDNDITLIIALDCGIRANKQISYASSKSIDFIICDHHLPGDTLPDAVAVLDPKRKDCLYPYAELSGCGIGFKLLQAFCIQNTIELDKLYNYLDLVAVSIASDIVPITGENRILSSFGIKKINRAPIPGLKSLIEVAGFHGELDISKIVFGIGPRINAAGRMGHAKSSVELLTCDNYLESLEMAKGLNLRNIERREYDESITEQALEIIRSQPNLDKLRSSVVFKKDWHKGIIGIVASRCIEKFYKPTIVLTESEGKITGSARSVDGFNIYEAISACDDLLEKYGGHKYAAGLTLSSEKLKEFQNRFEEEVSNTITEDQLVPKIAIDSEIDLSEIDFNFYNVLRQMGPFGPQNMQPVFLCRNVSLTNPPRVLKDQHLKLFISQNGTDSSFDAIGFNMIDKKDMLSDAFSIAFTIEENNYMGNKTLQLVLKDIKATIDED